LLGNNVMLISADNLALCCSLKWRALPIRMKQVSFARFISPNSKTLCMCCTAFKRKYKGLISTISNYPISASVNYFKDLSHENQQLYKYLGCYY
jgi:hypothetical protein